MKNERRLADGRVELIDTRRVEASPLYNHDLAPVPLARRNWSTYNYAALWVSMAHCIPTYMLASGLMASGMNWSQALVACGWFGIQAWIGGEALHVFFKAIVPAWPTLLGAGIGGHTTTEWLSFL